MRAKLPLGEIEFVWHLNPPFWHLLSSSCKYLRTLNSKVFLARFSLKQRQKNALTKFSFYFWKWLSPCGISKLNLIDESMSVLIICCWFGCWGLIMRLLLLFGLPLSKPPPLGPNWSMGLLIFRRIPLFAPLPLPTVCLPLTTVRKLCRTIWELRPLFCPPRRRYQLVINHYCQVNWLSDFHFRWGFLLVVSFYTKTNIDLCDIFLISYTHTIFLEHFRHIEWDFHMF